MFERFTAAARAAVVDAQERAQEFGHSEIGAGHILLGTLGDSDGTNSRVLAALGLDRSALVDGVRSTHRLDADALALLGIDLTAVRDRAEAAFGPGALDRGRRQRRGLFDRRGGHGNGHIAFSREVTSGLENALRVALAAHHGFIGTEHILLGLLAARPGTAIDLLHRAGVVADPVTIKDRLLAELSSAR